ncbi:hypothetical protein Q1695_015894 [Nippostrongylus brasiliensis]|nr:hypothetical protein Q1695_015894 [Nippostrongylus brasiliensis]
MFLPGGLLWPKSNLSSESTRDEHDPSTGYDFLGSDTLTRANTDNSTIRNNLQDVWPLAEEGSFRQAVTHNEYMVAKCGFVSNNCSSVCDCDLLWRDPRSHGLEPDKGLAMWGDPDITNSRPIRNWLVGEGEEEDLEDAIARNPCIDESQDSEDMTKMAGGDSVQTWPFPFPKPNAKRIVTGWSDCEKDCKIFTGFHYYSLIAVVAIILSRIPGIDTNPLWDLCSLVGQPKMS